MGKLMRIALSEELPKTTPFYREMKAEDDRYSSFKAKTLLLALENIFKEVCFLEEATTIRVEELDKYPEGARLIANATLPSGQDFILLAGSRPDQFLANPATLKGHKDNTAALWLSSKLAWKVFKKTQWQWKEHGNGLKADSAYIQIQQALKGA